MYMNLYCPSFFYINQQPDIDITIKHAIIHDAYQLDHPLSPSLNIKNNAQLSKLYDVISKNSAIFVDKI